jgi:hypothetical protein
MLTQQQTGVVEGILCIWGLFFCIAFYFLGADFQLNSSQKHVPFYTEVINFSKISNQYAETDVKLI